MCIYIYVTLDLEIRRAYIYVECKAGHSLRFGNS